MIQLLSITFPQGFQISIFFGNPTLGSESKKTFKWYLKSEQTHRQTHTDRQTYGQIDLTKASAQRADALKSSQILERYQSGDSSGQKPRKP